MTTRPILRTRDVRDVYRLLSEVRSLGDQPDRWPMYAVEGMRQMLGGVYAAAALVPIPAPGSDEPVVPEISIIVGPDSEEHRERLIRGLQNSEIASHPYFQRRFAMQLRFATLRRHDVISDEEFYAHPDTRRFYLDLGGDHFLHSEFVSLSIGKIVGLLVYRAVGEPPFGRREQRMLKLFHLEMARMWKSDLAVPDDYKVRELTPRQKQVLWMLCSGENEQHIADRLSISLHTVHDHVKALHKHFEVSSRAELLVKVLRHPQRPLGEMSMPDKAWEAKGRSEMSG